MERYWKEREREKKRRVNKKFIFVWNGMDDDDGDDEADENIRALKGRRLNTNRESEKKKRSHNVK